MQHLVGVHHHLWVAFSHEVKKGRVYFVGLTLQRLANLVAGLALLFRKAAWVSALTLLEIRSVRSLRSLLSHSQFSSLRFPSASPGDTCQASLRAIQYRNHSRASCLELASIQYARHCEEPMPLLLSFSSLSDFVPASHAAPLFADLVLNHHRKRKPSDERSDNGKRDEDGAHLSNLNTSARTSGATTDMMVQNCVPLRSSEARHLSAAPAHSAVESSAVITSVRSRQPPNARL